MGLINVTATWRPGRRASRRAACIPANPAPTMTTRLGGVASVMCVISWVSLCVLDRRCADISSIRLAIGGDIRRPADVWSSGALATIGLQALEPGRPAVAEDRLDADLIAR